MYAMQKDNSEVAKLTTAVSHLIVSNWNDGMMSATKDWVSAWIQLHYDDASRLILESRSIRIQGCQYPTDKQDKNVIVNILAFLTLMQVELEIKSRSHVTNGHKEEIKVIGIVKQNNTKQ